MLMEHLSIAIFLGPLIGLENFHPACIRWCLMHVVHLGILFTVTGSALILVCVDQHSEGFHKKTCVTRVTQQCRVLD